MAPATMATIKSTTKWTLTTMIAYDCWQPTLFLVPCTSCHSTSGLNSINFTRFPLRAAHKPYKFIVVTATPEFFTFPYPHRSFSRPMWRDPGWSCTPGSCGEGLSTPAEPRPLVPVLGLGLAGPDLLKHLLPSIFPSIFPSPRGPCSTCVHCSGNILKIVWTILDPDCRHLSTWHSTPPGPSE